MTSDQAKQSCAEFQAHMAEMIGAGEDLSSHPHLKSCEDCRALLADLETIAEAARQLFPGVEPPDEVWEHIESAIKRRDETSPIEPNMAPET
jgi:predicted anti-sigma-YlaC factor YlaD